MAFSNDIGSILITSAGRRGELVRIWKEAALTHLGSRSKLFATDVNPSFPLLVKLPMSLSRSVVAADPDYPNQLLQQCLAHGIQLVIPTIDTELQVLSDSKIYLNRRALNLLLVILDL